MEWWILAVVVAAFGGVVGALRLRRRRPAASGEVTKNLYPLW